MMSSCGDVSVSSQDDHFHSIEKIDDDDNGEDGGMDTDTLELNGVDVTDGVVGHLLTDVDETLEAVSTAIQSGDRGDRQKAYLAVISLTISLMLVFVLTLFATSISSSSSLIDTPTDVWRQELTTVLQNLSILVSNSTRDGVNQG